MRDRSLWTSDDFIDLLSKIQPYVQTWKFYFEFQWFCQWASIWWLLIKNLCFKSIAVGPQAEVFISKFFSLSILQRGDKKTLSHPCISTWRWSSSHRSPDTTNYKWHEVQPVTHRTISRKETNDQRAHVFQGLLLNNSGQKILIYMHTHTHTPIKVNATLIPITLPL